MDTKSRYHALRGSCPIERFMMDMEKFRCMPAKFPIPYPFSHGPVRSAIVQNLMKIVGQACRDSLQATNLDLVDLRLVQLIPPQCHSGKDVLTADVRNKDYDQAAWYKAATALQEIVDREIKHQKLDIQLPVEIRNSDKMSQERSGPIHFNSPEHNFFLQTRDKIEDVIKENCKNWNSISYHMRGYKNGVKRRATVVIGINPQSVMPWGNVYENILRELDTLQNDINLNPQRLSIYLELIAGTMSPCLNMDDDALNPKINESLTRAPQPGASIGSRGASEYGTMGSYVYATSPSGQVTACFLTCYHVIRGGVDKAQMEKNDKYGICLDQNTARDTIVVEYPAPRDAKATREQAVRALSSSITDISAAARETLAILDHHQREAGLGKVIHASGYGRVSRKNHRLDWALVALNDPMLLKQNLAVRRDQIPPTEQDRLTQDMYPNRTIDIRINSVMRHDELKKGHWLLKGRTRTTGSHSGEVNALRAKIVWQDPDMRSWTTWEDEIFMGDHSAQSFGHIGDSGSATHNTKYATFGMVVGNVASRDVTFVTPLEYILEDIKTATGLTVTLA